MTIQRENEIKKLLGSFDNALYWLSVLVAFGDITEAEAGYFITEYKL